MLYVLTSPMGFSLLMFGDTVLERYNTREEARLRQEEIERAARASEIKAREEHPEWF